MGVNGVSSNGQVGFQTIDNFAGLSPEMMLAYMQANMQSFDQQIAGILDDMNARRADMAELNDAIRQLRTLQARARDSRGDSIDADTQLDPAVAEQRQQYVDAIREAARGQNGLGVGDLDMFGNGQPWQLGARDWQAVQRGHSDLAEFDEAHADTTVRGMLERFDFDQETIDSVIDGDGNISVDNLQTLIDQLESRQTEINDRTEYDSMRVGALMQKRSQMIQLTSNIMRDLNETAKAVIQNI
jgi:hypothetical protein